jgi:putative oxidoreductase
MRARETTITNEVVRVLLGVIFLWAATSKISNPTQFLAALYAYDLHLPRTILQAVAVVLPWLELISGLLLIVNQWTESALICIFGMTLVFLLVSCQAWIRHLDISCGCFNLQILGLDQRTSRFAHVIESVGFAFFRNLILTGASACLLKCQFRQTRSEALSESQVRSDPR